MSPRWRISSSKIPHEIVKPGQIVKVKVTDVDLKRQRISLTMRLDDAPRNAPRQSEARADANPNAARGQRDKQPPEAKRPPNRAPQPTGLFALALEKAKLKK